MGDVEWEEDQKERVGCGKSDGSVGTSFSLLILGIIQVCWLMLIIT